MKAHKRFTMLAAASAVVMGMVGAAFAQSWDCGAAPNTVFAALSGGTLTISGAGAMKDYSASACGGSDAPWGECGRTDIARVVIEDGVTYIGKNAFFSRLGLTSVKIAESVTAIGQGAFYGCGGLKSVTASANLPQTADNVFEDVPLNSVTLFVPQASIASYNAANEWKNFGDIKPLSADDGQPWQCGSPNLSDVIATLNDGTLTISGTGNMVKAFAVTGSMVGPSCTDMPDYEVEPCIPSPWDDYKNTITNVVIEDGVTFIANGAFISYQMITSVTIGKDVAGNVDKWIGGNVKLASVTVSTGNANYSSIDGILFNKNKTTLVFYPMAKTDTSYTIPDGVTSIAPGAFAIARNLTTVTIPQSVTLVEGSAFMNSGLKSITILATTPPSVAGDAFSGVAYEEGISSVPLYAPDESVELYRSADVWKNFDVQPLGNTAVASARNAMRKPAALVSVRGRTLNVNAGTNSKAQIRVITLTGKTAASFNAMGNAKLSLKGIPSGTYIIEAKRAADGRRVTSPVVLR